MSHAQKEDFSVALVANLTNLKNTISSVMALASTKLGHVQEHATQDTLCAICMEDIHMRNVMKIQQYGHVMGNVNTKVFHAMVPVQRDISTVMEFVETKIFITLVLDNVLILNVLTHVRLEILF